MRFYLASTSPARLMLLRQIGIEPIVVPSFVDEEAAVSAAEFADGPLTAPALVLLLARLKAEAVRGTLVDGAPIDGIVFGGDSAFEIGGAIHGKPHLPDVARARWLSQRGQSGILYSGHWMIDHRQPFEPATAPAVGAVDSAVVEFESDISDAEIDDYVNTGEPLEVAGAFTVDGLAAPFIRSVTGAPSAVIGLSLPTIRSLAGQLGLGLGAFRN